jgi:hypothetical protein
MRLGEYNEIDRANDGKKVASITACHAAGQAAMKIGNV